MPSRSLGHRAPLLWVLLPLMAGLISGRLGWFWLSPIFAATAGVVILGLAMIPRFQRVSALALLAGIFLSGVALYELRRARLPAWDALPPREIRATLQVDRLFEPRPDGKSISGLGRLLVTEAHLADLRGQSVYFSVNLKRGQPRPLRSAKIELSGVLQTLPENPPADTFDGYLANQGINYRISRGQLNREVAPAGAYRHFCDTALKRFTVILTHGIEGHAMQGAVLRAMLLGTQKELSDTQSQSYRESGTMHLFSISGLHIAVIAAVIHGLLSLCRLPRVALFLAGAVLLWLYVDITGCAPSAVRAFLMVLCLHLSRVLRTPSNPFSALVASAVIVLMWQPMQLFTASFQLSYGIVAVLLLLGLPLSECWLEKAALFKWLPPVSWRWHQHARDWLWRALVGALGIGLATTLVSTLSGVVIFKLFTPVSLLANLVLIPVGSMVIICGFITLLCGLLGLGWMVIVLNHASVLMVIFLERSVALFIRLPEAFHAAQFKPDWLGFVALGGLLATILYGYSAQWENRRGGLWAPFVFSALLVALGMRFI